MTQNPTGLLAEGMADLALVLVVSAALTPLLQRLRQPRVIAEIIAGLALGPSLLGLLPGHLTDRFFPAAARPDLSAVAQVAILLFMFLVGWEIEPAEMLRNRNAVLGVCLASVTLPFAAGVLLALGLYRDHAVVGGHHVGRAAFVLFIGTAMATTAFPVLARIIREHRLESTRVGAVALASAAVGDVIAWCLLALVSAVATSSGSGRLLRVVAFSILYGLVLAAVVRPLLRLLISRHSSGDHVSLHLLPLVASGALLSGYVVYVIGLDPIFGAFAFGLAMPRNAGPALRERIRVPMEQMTSLLLPAFFVVTGLSVDIASLSGSGTLELLAVCAVACLGKIAGAGVAARASGMSWADSRAVGLLMNTRGLTELIILNVGRTLGVLDTRMFTMLTVMAVLTTAMAGPFVPRLPEARTSESGDSRGALVAAHD